MAVRRVPVAGLVLWVALCPAARTEDALTTRLIPVGFLTGGRTDHVGMAPPRVLPDGGSRENEPLFGAEGEEPVLPFGTVDELAEQIRSAVEPAYWRAQEGADLRAVGEHLLCARADPAVLDRVSAFVRELEQRTAEMVRVEVHAARLTLSELLRLRDASFAPDAVAGVLDRPRPLAALMLTVFAGAQAAAFAGTQRAWVADQAVEVATGARIADPWVNVANLGLIVQVRARPVPASDDILLHVDASLGRLADARSVDTGEEQRIEAVAHEVLRVRTEAVVGEGVWTVLSTGARPNEEDGWLLFARAKRVPAPRTGPPEAPLDLPPLPAGPPARRTVGDLELVDHPVDDLAVSVRSVRGEGTGLGPSAYDPPLPPELPEPVPILAPDALVDLIRAASPDRVWWEPASIDVRYGSLRIRNAPEVHRGVEDWLRRIRARHLGTLWVSAELLEAEPHLAATLLEAGSREGDVLPALLEFPETGAIRRVAVAEATSLDGARNTTVAGRLVRYVHDADPRIAEAAAIEEPEVTEFLDGVELDVQPRLATDGRTVHVSLSYLRSEPSAPMREARVAGGGTIELPELGLERVRTDLALELDRPAVVASWSREGRHRLLVLEARLR